MIPAPERIVSLNRVQVRWTEIEKEFAEAKIAEGYTYAAIAKMMGRSDAAVRKWKFRQGERIFKRAKRESANSTDAPPELLADRDARANEPRSLSAIMFGDPPPSRSALGRPCE